MVLDLATTNTNILRNRIFRCSAAERHLLSPGCDVLELRTETEIREAGLRKTTGITKSLPLEIDESRVCSATKMEHNYLKWALQGNLLFPKLFELFDASRPFAISCARGIDRTGFVASTLHLILGTEEGAIVNEYLHAGDSETKPHHLHGSLEEIKRRGGPLAYLRSVYCQDAHVSRF